MHGILYIEKNPDGGSPVCTVYFILRRTPMAGARNAQNTIYLEESRRREPGMHGILYIEDE